MNKADLVDAVYNNEDYDFSTKASSEEAVKAVVEGIRQGLLTDGKVQLIGFGSFTVKERAARWGRNPQTGEKIRIPARKTVTFSPGKALKEQVND